VVAAANPLRGLAADAATVSDLVSTVDGPVVLARHSYGGAVISDVDADAGDLAGLVYVAGFLLVPVRRAAPKPPGRAPALHGQARRQHRTIEIPGASHAISVAHPEATAHLILEAAALRVTA